MLVNKIGIVRLIKRCRIRPAQHLMLKLWVLQVIKEITKSVYQVTFGNNHKDRKPHVQSALDHIKLSGNFGCFLLNFISSIFNKTIRRNY